MKCCSSKPYGLVFQNEDDDDDDDDEQETAGPTISKTRVHQEIQKDLNGTTGNDRVTTKTWH